MKKITLSFFFLISSFLGFSQINEGFEGATFPPTTAGNWIVQDNGVGTAVNWIETTDPTRVRTGLKAALVERDIIPVGTISEDWLITSQFVVPANGQLRFFTRLGLLGNNGTTFDIKASTNATQTNQAAFTTTLATYTESTIVNPATYNVYEEKIINFPAALVGQSVYVAFIKVFNRTSSIFQGDRWLIDDVKVLERCLDPSILTVGVTTPTTASLAWTNNGSATQWEVEVIPATNTPTGTGIPASTNPFVVTGLTPGTQYKYYVRSLCSTGTISQWIGPFNFFTKPSGSICTSPIAINTLPFSQSSNTNLFGDEVDTPQGTSCGAIPATTNYLQGDEVFYSYTATFTGLISITMNSTVANSSLFVYGGCPVGTSCLAGVANTATTPRIINNFGVTAGQTYIIVISSSTNPTPASGIPYSLIIQQENCTKPAALTATNIGTTTANLSWSNPSAATTWQVEIQPAGSNIPTGAGTLTATTNTNFAVTGLTAATAYQYWVRADCGSGIFSAWAGPFLFNTNICEAAQRCIYNFRTNDSFGDGWNGNTMSVRQNGVVVATIVGPTDPDNLNFIDQFVPLCETLPFELFWNSGGNSPREVGISVINNFGQTLYTRLPNNSGIGVPNTQLYSASFDCDTPACLPPNTLTATAITTSTANLSWTANGSTAWDVYLIPTGGSAPIASTIPTYANVNTNPLPVSGLSPLTTYQFYVRAICTATSNSIWAEPFSFTTLPTCPSPTTLTTTALTATSVTLGWTDAVSASGWEILTLPCGSPAPTSTSTGFISASTNPFTINGLTSGVCYDLYVRSICTPTDSSVWSLKKTITTPPSCGSMFYDNGGLLGDYLPSTNNPTVNQIITIFPTNVGDKVTVTFEDFDVEPRFDGLYVYNGNSTAAPQISSANIAGVGVAMATPGAFWGTTIPGPFTSTSPDGSLTFVFKSDPSIQRDGWEALVTCNPPPICGKPLSLEANSITQTTANLTWSQPATPGTATSWEIIVQVATLVNPTGSGVVTTNPYNATGLLPGTLYEFYVRSNCSVDGYSLWAGPFPFATKVINDECINAITLTVNDDASCSLLTAGSIVGATASSPNIPPTTPPTTPCATNIDDDVWFQFTATSANHYVSFLNVIGSSTSLGSVLYTGTCGGLVQVKCGNTFGNPAGIIANNLVVGAVYYVRVYTTTTTPNQTVFFNVCVGSQSVCETSEGLCADPVDIKIFPNTVGVPSEGTIACLITVPNPTYYYITVGVAGNINFEISQNTSYDTSGNPTGTGLDVDFVAWGPFSSNTAACGTLSQGCPGPAPGGCQNNTTAPAGYYPFSGTNIVDCSYSFLPVETFTINNAQVGQVYVVLITNYNGASGSIKFTQLNQTIPPTPGSGASDCNIICNSNLGPDQTVCGVTSVVLNPQITNPDATFKWYRNGVLINLPPNSFTYTATESGTYKVITTCGLNDDPDTMVLTFGPTVIVPDQPNYKICDDISNDGIATFDLSTLTPNVISGLDTNFTYNVSYHYTEANALANTFPINPLVPYVGMTQTIYIRISAVGASACNTVIAQNLVVSPTPAGTLTSSDADNTICSNEIATITFNPTNFVATAATYVWTLNGVVIPTATTNVISPAASGTYQVVATLNGCGSVASSILFTVNPQPNFTLSDTNLIKCVNEFATITVVPTNFSLTDPLVSYQWSLNGVVQPLFVSSTISVTDYGNYSVVISRVGCASLPKSKEVILDTTDIPINTNGECVGINYIITSTPISGSFVPSPTTVIYQWTNESGTTVGSNQNTFNVTAYVIANNIPPSSFPTSFTVKVTTLPDGCTDTQTFEVKSASCVVQKGLSPNGDGSNDSFDLRGLDVKQLSIFNRYGTKIYSQANYKDEWQGQNSKSENSPVGTYYYVIELNNGETKTGWVYLNR